jgi:hypothetical protein
MPDPKQHRGNPPPVRLRGTVVHPNTTVPPLRFGERVWLEVSRESTGSSRFTIHGLVVGINEEGREVVIDCDSHARRP